MAERSELEQLAQRYLDLWQDQMSALAADGEFTDMMGRLTAALGPAAAAAPWTLWPAMLGALVPGAAWPGVGRPETAARTEAGGRRGDGDKARAPESAAEETAAPGTAAAAAAPFAGRPDLVELADRLAALEERVAALESGTRPARRSPRGGAAKRRS